MKVVTVSPLTFEWYMMLSIFMGLSLVLLFVVKRISLQWKERILRCIGFAMLFDLLFMEGYLLYNGNFSMSVSLPLAYCSIMEIFAICAAIFQSKRCFEFAIFFGITGPVQAFAAPAQVVIGEEYILIDYFLTHGLTILIPIYMAVCMGFKPRKGSIFKVILGMELIAVVVYLINIQLGANYMYLLQKPEVNHLLNFAPWPYYILNWHVCLYTVAFLINGLFVFNSYLDRKTTGLL